MGSIVEVVNILTGVLTILALLAGGGLAVFVFFQMAPVLTLRVSPSWVDEAKHLIALRFEVENKSRVRVNRPRGRIQVLEYAEPTGSLSHWVPFDRNSIRPEEQPLEWREPVPIFQSTLHIYPGEMVSFERIHHYSDKAALIHVGLQVEPRLGFWGRLINRKREPWRQTTTCFFRVGGAQ